MGGISGIIEDKINGILVEPRSSGGIVNAILEICSNKRLFKNLVTNGYKTAKNNSFEKQQKRLLDIVRRHFDCN